MFALALAHGASADTPDFAGLAGLAVQPYEPPKPAPALALPDLDGRTVRLDDFRGKVVLLVNFREDPGLVRRTVRERGYVAPVLLDRSGDVTGRVWGVFGPPTMYFIDRQGRLIGRAVGPRDWESEAGRRFIHALLASGGGR